MYSVRKIENQQFSVIASYNTVSNETTLEEVIEYDLVLTERQLFSFFKHWGLSTADLWDALEHFDTMGYDRAEFSERGNLLFCSDQDLAS